jgi:hypothetical protein
MKNTYNITVSKSSVDDADTLSRACFGRKKFTTITNISILLIHFKNQLTRLCSAFFLNTPAPDAKESFYSIPSST